MSSIYQLPAMQKYRGALDRARGKLSKTEDTVKELAVVGGSAYLTGRLAASGGPNGRKLFGIDAELVIAGVSAGLALTGAAGDYEETAIQAAGGALAAYAARKGFEQGLAAQARAAAAQQPAPAPAQVSGWPRTEVGAGNYAADFATLGQLNRTPA